MGQRLTIAIKENNKIQATTYYHWSGNTKSAAELVSTILNTTIPLGACDPYEKAVHLLQATDADFIGDRNKGVIRVTECGVAESMENTDHIVTIDYDNMTVDFGMFYGRDIDDELDLNETESDIPTISDIRETNFDHTAVPFDGWSDFVKFISENEFFVDQCDTGDDIPVVWQVIK